MSCYWQKWKYCRFMQQLKQEELQELKKTISQIGIFLLKHFY
jgi:hypothetical protein